MEQPMKGTSLVISTIALACAITIGAISDSHAIKLCQLDWFNAWRAASGVLSSPTYMHTLEHGSQASSGAWSVTSDQGSVPVKHTVSGTSQCSSIACPTPPCASSSPSLTNSSTNANNKYCWCRMNAPNLGASWVFAFADSSGALCANNCASNCSACVWIGANNSCSRSALLALPQ
jgi:hypothetical protein